MCCQIKTIEEYVKEICVLNEKRKRDYEQRYHDGDMVHLYERKEFLFRGLSNTNYELVPSIGRGKSHYSDNGILDNESNLIAMAQYKFPNIFRREMAPAELLALLQHYAIPTRLLDVTENAFVALYFACRSSEKMEGEVVVFENNNIDIAPYPFINAIADTYKFIPRGNNIFLDNFYELAAKQSYFSEQVILSDSEGAKWIEEVCKEPIFIYAPIQTPRQRAQQGRYILFPNDIQKDHKYKDKKCFVNMISPMKKNNKCISSFQVLRK